MTSQSNVPDMQPREVGDYAFARARDLAFDAVYTLWLRRRGKGWTQKKISDRLEREPAWVSRSFRGPGNWTLRTLAELAEALDGVLEIRVTAVEDFPRSTANYHAYSEYPDRVTTVGAGIGPRGSTETQIAKLTTQPTSTAAWNDA